MRMAGRRQHRGLDRVGAVGHDVDLEAEVLEHGPATRWLTGLSSASRTRRGRPRAGGCHACSRRDAASIDASCSVNVSTQLRIVALDVAQVVRAVGEDAGGRLRSSRPQDRARRRPPS